MEALDFSISIVIVLFILSIITEKFTQLIKNYSSFFNVIFFLLSISLIARGLIIYYGDFIDCSYAILLGRITILINFWELYFFRKKRSTKKTILILLSGLTINAYSFSYNSFSLYFTFGCILLYFSLVSLLIIEEIDFQIKGRMFGTKFFKRIEKTTLSTLDEPKREKEITTLSIFTGICVAYLFNANFFYIITDIDNNTGDGITKQFGWPQFPLSYHKSYFNFEHYIFESEYLFGILLTGFFLSFGSKFFHDLLETLFYAKRAKAALSDPDTFKLDTADKIVEWVNGYDIEKFYLKERKRILEREGFTAVGIGKVEFEGKVVEGLRIHCQAGSQDLQNLLEIQDEKNRNYKVPYQIFPYSGAVVLTNISIDATLEITNRKVINKVGAITHPVEVTGISGNFLLTCYHVVKGEEDKWEKFTSGSAEVAISSHSDMVIGSIYAGGRTSFAEAAIIKVDGKNRISKSFYPGFRLQQKQPRKIVKNDVGSKVLMYSRDSNSIIEGHIVASDITGAFPFEGDEEKTYEMYELIEVQNSADKPIQRFGDSGNLLFDEQYRPIGIVFAKDNVSTFVMRLEKALNVFDKLNVTLKINDI